jgi:hypothetical protein
MILAQNEWRKVIREELKNDIFAYGKGRKYDRWIDTVGGVARDNGHNEGDLIQHPTGIIESILRDDVFVERDLVMGTPSGRDAFPCTGLRSSTDDYYNNSIVYRVTDGARDYVANFVGSGQSIELSGAGNPAAEGEKFYLTNVQGDNKIDIASFDKVGNTTDGLRKDWIFGKSIHTAESAQSILEKLCFESHCILFNTFNGYKLVALDEEEETTDTWTVPLNRLGERELVRVRLSPLSDVFTDFRLKYHYDYGSGQYKKEFFISKNSLSSNATILSSIEQTLCGNAETDYRVKKYFEYSADWIYDDNTAEYLLQKLVRWLTKQYVIVAWTGKLGTYIKYERGDQVVIDYSNMVHDSLNNTAKFMIFDKTINPGTQSSSPDVTFQLIEMGAGLSGYGFLYGGRYGTGL